MKPHKGETLKCGKCMGKRFMAEQTSQKKSNPLQENRYE